MWKMLMNIDLYNDEVYAAITHIMQAEPSL